ncbi:MAG: 2-(1,2-epoxy-1,2-dihydrophenyl)acetyl-CoA isomerase [Acidobacteriaceae bacterium]|nr:2-(1,2-epoxy-1,2-dihydrophenyl)acetyl-CoA isomerase [Acidobacteriaceae bacterium]
MTFETVLFAIENGAARLTLNRPEKLNSFNVQMHLDIRHALDEVERNEDVRVLVISGAGRGFCAGQDLSDRVFDPNQKPDLGASIENYYAPLVRRLRALPIPVVAAVNGVAAGAGANLALACDLVIAAKSAAFIESFSKLGLIPDTGGTYFLPRLAGTARAMGMALLGEKVPAEQAEAWGLIWRAVDDEQFASTVDAIASQLSSAPTKGLAHIKRAIYASAHHSLDEQLNMERDLMRELGESHDFREGVAAFLEKRAPRFIGR